MMLVHCNLLIEKRVLGPAYKEEPMHTASGQSLVKLSVSNVIAL